MSGPGAAGDSTPRQSHNESAERIKKRKRGEKEGGSDEKDESIDDEEEEQQGENEGEEEEEEEEEGEEDEEDEEGDEQEEEEEEEDEDNLELDDNVRQDNTEFERTTRPMGVPRLALDGGLDELMDEGTPHPDDTDEMDPGTLRAPSPAAVAASAADDEDVQPPEALASTRKRRTSSGSGTSEPDTVRPRKDTDPPHKLDAKRQKSEDNEADGAGASFNPPPGFPALMPVAPAEQLGAALAPIAVRLLLQMALSSTSLTPALDAMGRGGRSGEGHPLARNVFGGTTAPVNPVAPMRAPQPEDADEDERK